MLQNLIKHSQVKEPTDCAHNVRRTASGSLPATCESLNTIAAKLTTFTIVLILLQLLLLHVTLVNVCVLLSMYEGLVMKCAHRCSVPAGVLVRKVIIIYMMPVFRRSGSGCPEVEMQSRA